MPTPSIDRQLQELRALSDRLPDGAALERLRDYLGNRSNVIVARASKLAAGIPEHPLGPELVAAFHRFLVDPVRTDRGCLAKVAVVDALRASTDPNVDVFFAGLRHVQLEPTYGGRVDTAAALRAGCALGLVEAGVDGVLDELAVLLADAEADARLGAARALAACGPLATPLLRLKALTGDDQPLVTAECLSGLMTIAPLESFDFVSSLIDPARPEMSGHAAMALAESRMPQAFEVLKAKWDAALLPEFRRELLLPIGLTRDEHAPTFLLNVLESGDFPAATAAIAALAIYKGDAGVADRARRAASSAHRGRLLAVLERAFD